MACSELGSSMNASFTEHFSCKICLEILDDPVQCQRNEHYFCKSCIQKHILVQSQTCPLCMEDLTLEALRPIPRVVAEVLSQLRTPRCDFADRGCVERVAILNISAHHEVCGFAPILCSNEGCGATINRQDVASHENENCNFRKMKCEECGIEVVFQVYGRHSCVLRKEMDEMKACFKELQALHNVVKANSDFIKDLQDPLRNVTASSQIFVASDESFEVFDWSTKRWTLYSDIVFYSHRHSFSFPYKNNIMVCGGTKSNRIECINIKKDPVTSYSFPMLLPEPYQRNSVGKGALCGNYVFMFQNGEVCKIVLDSPPSSETVLSLPRNKWFYGVECIYQKIFILGGNLGGLRASENSINTVLLYDPSKNEMKTLAPLPYGVSQMATVPYKDNIIILGGQDSKDMPYNSVVMYNVNSQECHRLPSMLQKRSGCAAVIMEEVIIVMGGRGSRRESLKTVEYFVLGQDSWHELPSMHCPRYGATACVQL